ncbi:MAG TPA: matrixin family metalloprotease [Thermoanaerobaculia bacterium]|nr:matrixin family metalloprotease [Thermoanaerobaculia bacterium]
MLGLGHTSVSGATMYPSVSSCNNGPASLENDDKAAIQDLY